jgi:cytochrome c-type biogenesis protein CcmE
MSDQGVTNESAGPVVPSNTKWFALGALLIAGAGFALLAFGGLGENLVYYWGPKELRAAGDKAYGAQIRLGGQVKPGTIQFDAGSTSLDFVVTDTVAEVPVHSTGVPPQMFRENIGVVVEGTTTKGGTFTSTRLMVSHGNEYKPPKAGETYEAKDLILSAQSGEAGAK